jgi:hypothetical protein
MAESPAVIELRVRELSQMFDSRDPSPFREQDLAPSAEEYIVESVKELHGRVPSELIVHLDSAGAKDDDERILANAVRTHFARRAQHLRLNLRELMRQGSISLGIGITFLVVFFVAGQALIRMLGENPWSSLARESLVIGGWVALWRPLEIFLYSWWPLVGERRMHERLSRMRVRVVTRR